MESRLEQLQNSDGVTRQMRDERIDGPTVLRWGLMLGAAVSLVAVLWRRLHTKEQPAQPPPARPPLDMALEGAEPGVTQSPAGEAPKMPSVTGTASAQTALPRRSLDNGWSEPADEARKLRPAHPAPVPATEKAAPPHPVQPARWREPTKYIVGAGLFVAILFILYISRSVLPILILAALLALIVHPVIRFFQKQLKLSKGLSVATTYLQTIVLGMLIPLLVVPALISSVNSVLSIDFQGLSQEIAQALQDLSAQVAGIPVLNWLLGPFLDSLAVAIESVSSAQTPEAVSYEVTMGGIVERLASTLGTIVKLLGPVVSAVISLVFLLRVSFYLSLSGDAIMESYPRPFPPAVYREIIALVRRIEGVWARFLRGITKSWSHQWPKHPWRRNPPFWIRSGIGSAR